jgi:subtilisin family serine protease
LGANVIWVNGDISIIQEIAPLSAVKEIIENASYTFPKPIENIESTSESRTIEWGITKTQADKVWALGYTGQGIVIGGDDTGYDWTHPALKKKYRGWNGTSADHNYNWHDAVKSGNGGACGINALPHVMILVTVPIPWEPWLAMMKQGTRLEWLQAQAG